MRRPHGKAIVMVAISSVAACGLFSGGPERESPDASSDASMDATSSDAVGDSADALYGDGGPDVIVPCSAVCPDAGGQCIDGGVCWFDCTSGSACQKPNRVPGRGAVLGAVHGQRLMRPGHPVRCRAAVPRRLRRLCLYGQDRVRGQPVHDRLRRRIDVPGAGHVRIGRLQRHVRRQRFLREGHRLQRDQYVHGSVQRRIDVSGQDHDDVRREHHLLRRHGLLLRHRHVRKCLLQGRLQGRQFVRERRQLQRRNVRRRGQLPLSASLRLHAYSPGAIFRFGIMSVQWLILDKPGNDGRTVFEEKP